MFERTILAAFVTAVSLADASFITAKPGPSPVLKARDADPDLLGWYYVSDYGGCMVYLRNCCVKFVMGA
jgi:hypothetical protein